MTNTVETRPWEAGVHGAISALTTSLAKVGSHPARCFEPATIKVALGQSFAFADRSSSGKSAPVTAIGSRAIRPQKVTLRVSCEQNPTPRLDGCDLRPAGCALGILS